MLMLTRFLPGHTPDKETNSRAVPIYATTVCSPQHTFLPYVSEKKAYDRSPTHSTTALTVLDSSASKSLATSTAELETQLLVSLSRELPRSKVVSLRLQHHQDKLRSLSPFLLWHMLVTTLSRHQIYTEARTTNSRSFFHVWA